MDQAISTADRPASGLGGDISFDEIVRLAVEACPSGMIMTEPPGKSCW